MTSYSIKAFKRITRICIYCKSIDFFGALVRLCNVARSAGLGASQKQKKNNSPIHFVWGFFNNLKPIKVGAIELHLRD